MERMTLSEIANELKLDKGTIIPSDGAHHGPRLHFTTIYEKYFDSTRDKKINILEIGISNGNSLNLWLRFFPNANIYLCLESVSLSSGITSSLLCSKSSPPDSTEGTLYYYQ